MKKKLKGFTLVEVIVALSIFSIMALMLAMMFTATCALRLNTNSMNKKVDNQVAIAENPPNVTADKVGTTYTIQFGTAPVSVEVYQQDKADLQIALAAPDKSALTGHQKELYDAKDSPNIMTFK